MSKIDRFDHEYDGMWKTSDGVFVYYDDMLDRMKYVRQALSLSKEVMLYNHVQKAFVDKLIGEIDEYI